MMVSPEAYYENTLKFKNKEQLHRIIRSFKAENNYHIKLLEGCYGDSPELHRHPTPDVIIAMNELYIEQAKLALHNLGDDYIPTLQEVKAEQFNQRLDNLVSIEYDFWAFFVAGCGQNKVEISGENLSFFKTVEMEEVPCNSDFSSKEQLVGYLRELKIANWKKIYCTQQFVTDLPTWDIKLKFSDGGKSVNFHGCGAWPWNFEKFNAIFGD